MSLRYIHVGKKELGDTECKSKFRFSLTMCVIKISKSLIIPLFPECDLDAVFLDGKI